MDALGMVVFHKDDLWMPGSAINGVGAVLVMTPTKSRDSISDAAFGRRITRRTATRMPRPSNAASISAKTSGATGWRDPRSRALWRRALGEAGSPRSPYLSPYWH